MAREIRPIAFDIEDQADKIIMANVKLKKFATELTQVKDPNSAKIGKDASELIRACSEISSAYKKIALIVDNLK